MKRLCLLAAIFVLLSCWYGYKTYQERLYLERLIWTEFDAAMDGLERFLRLAGNASERPPAATHPALLTAYELSLTIRRLAPVVELLLERRGVRAEPLAGYLFSITGGVASLCAETRQRGVPDQEWLGELRRRVGHVHRAVNRTVVERLSKKELQRAVDSLFGIDPAASYFTAAAEIPACPYI